MRYVVVPITLTFMLGLLVILVDDPDGLRSPAGIMREPTNAESESRMICEIVDYVATVDRPYTKAELDALYPPETRRIESERCWPAPPERTPAYPTETPISPVTPIGRKEAPSPANTPVP